MKWLPIVIAILLLLPGSQCFAISLNAHLGSASSATRSLKNPNAAYASTLDDVVILVTSKGNISIELFSDMPITSGNFKNLTEYGIYDGTTFSRVSQGFVIQGGDATLKGIIVPTIHDELPNKHSNIRGSVGMAKTSQPNSANSQFYINLVDNTFLDQNYTVFGKVIAGMSVVDTIGNVATNPPGDGQPLSTITITRAVMGQPVPEYSLPILLTLFVTATLFTVIFFKRKTTKVRNILRSPAK